MLFGKSNTCELISTKYIKLEGGEILSIPTATMTNKNRKKKKMDDPENQVADKEKKRVRDSSSSLSFTSDDNFIDDDNMDNTNGKTPEITINGKNGPTLPKYELYKPTDKQPFYVNVVVKEGEIDPFDLGKKIKQFKIEKVESIKTISKSTASTVCLNDWKNANKLIKINGLAAMEQYELVIPSCYVYSDGIVRDIPLYITNDEIRMNTRSTAQIIEVNRLNYWNFTLKQSLPSKTVKITFRAPRVPEEVYIHYVATKVSAFIPRPLYCIKCLSYGHFKKYCDPKKVALCKICTEPVHDGNSPCIPKCKQCPPPANQKHQSNDRVCPEFQRQHKIKETMTLNKITFKEAKLKLQLENPTPAESQLKMKKTYANTVKETEHLMESSSKIRPKATDSFDVRDIF